MSEPIIAASILSADFARLGEDIDAVLKAGADWVHFDVMDNHFVPNLTIGPMVCASLREYGVTAPIDVHLMIEPVDKIVPAFAKAGASYITFHPEASGNAADTLKLIHDSGCKAGLVVNPDKKLDIIQPYLDDIEILLLMSVFPGFGGQAFIPETLDKLRQAREIIDQSGRTIRLEIDGGVGIENIGDIAGAGADTFVSGSSIFGADDYKQTIRNMRIAIDKVNS